MILFKLNNRTNRVYMRHRMNYMFIVLTTVALENLVGHAIFLIRIGMIENWMDSKLDYGCNCYWMICFWVLLHGGTEMVILIRYDNIYVLVNWNRKLSVLCMRRSRKVISELSDFHNNLKNTTWSQTVLYHL